MLTILGIDINIDNLSIGQRSIHKHISSWYIYNYGTIGSLIMNERRRWQSAWRWPEVGCGRCVLVVVKVHLSLVPSVCLPILCAAIVARKAAIHLIFSNHSQVSVYCRLRSLMLKKRNSPLPLPLYFSARFLHQVLHFHYCRAQNTSLAILAVFKARRISDCSGCTWPPLFAIVENTLTAEIKLLAESKSEIRLLSLPYTHL